MTSQQRKFIEKIKKENFENSQSILKFEPFFNYLDHCGNLFALPLAAQVQIIRYNPNATVVLTEEYWIKRFQRIVDKSKAIPIFVCNDYDIKYLYDISATKPASHNNLVNIPTWEITKDNENSVFEFIKSSENIDGRNLSEIITQIIPTATTKIEEVARESAIYAVLKRCNLDFDTVKLENISKYSNLSNGEKYEALSKIQSYVKNAVKTIARSTRYINKTFLSKENSTDLQKPKTTVNTKTPKVSKYEKLDAFLLSTEKLTRYRIYDMCSNTPNKQTNDLPKLVANIFGMGESEKYKSDGKGITIGTLNDNQFYRWKDVVSRSNDLIKNNLLVKHEEKEDFKNWYNQYYSDRIRNEKLHKLHNSLKNEGWENKLVSIIKEWFNIAKNYEFELLSYFPIIQTEISREVDQNSGASPLL